MAARLAYRFFDTGAMYRAITWLALREGIDPHDAAALVALAEHASIDVRESPAGDAERTSVIIAGANATPHLRDADVEAHVSLVSRVAGVRTALVRIQRDLAANGRVVMAGRDIGTIVLPRAELKVYLDASRRVRAERRAAQMGAAGRERDIEALMTDLARRDGIDSAREVSPLTAAHDAVIINTDEMTIDEVVARIVELAL